MSPTRVSVLTPPGSAAIAVLAIQGPRAREFAAKHFHSARALPAPSPSPRFRFGRFGSSKGDEVLLVLRSHDHIEIHCHGGRQVVAWLLALLAADGVQETPWQEFVRPHFADPVAAALLPFARTRRTAAILLDQANGAYARTVAAIEAGGVDASSLRETLQRYAVVGRHLVEPWTVAIVGKPNAGKSTLLNALAGFDRSIVSPIAGTTRDAVSVSLAFDGWPVDVIDTAGLRESGDTLEQEGVRRAKDTLAASDLSLWIVDATEVQSSPLEDWIPTQSSGRVLVVLNKCDLLARPIQEVGGAISISAATGDCIPQLAMRMTELLVPAPPAPGEPVPYSPELSRRWS